MAGTQYALKRPFVRSLGDAIDRSIADEIQLQGKAIPCHVVAVDGPIVTVAFDVTSDYTLPQVTLPIAGSEYARSPTQVGDRGVVFPADASLGAVSGLGASTPPTLDAPANLAALVFFPVGNKDWQHVDGDFYTIYGPTGVTLRTRDGAIRLDLTANGISIQLSSGARVLVTGGNVEVNDSNVVVSGGDVTADTISLKNHIHPGVTTGMGDTGAPVP